MNFVRPRGSVEIDAAKVVEGNIGELIAPNSTHQSDSDGEIAADNVSGLLSRVSETSTREIDNLIADLRTLRKKMQADESRVQNDVEQFVALNQSVMQLTKIISDGMTLVKKKPEASNTGGTARNY
jgi:hypothetical protein